MGLPQDAARRGRFKGGVVVATVGPVVVLRSSDNYHKCASPGQDATTCTQANGNATVTLGAKGIIDPRTNRPIGENDPTYDEISNELADKGFLVVKVDGRGTPLRTAENLARGATWRYPAAAYAD